MERSDKSYECDIDGKFLNRSKSLKIDKTKGYSLAIFSKTSDFGLKTSDLGLKK